MTDLLPSPAVKNGLFPAVRALVVDALSVGAGGALPTNAQYLTEHGFTAGSLQRALNYLRERNAVGVVSRGHLGRFVDWINIGESWQAAGLDPVRLLIPPSGLIEMDVFADIFAETLTSNGIANAVHHAHGGHNRLTAAATGGTDIAVVSKSTLDLLTPTQLTMLENRPLVRELSNNTFYAPRRVMIVRRAGETNQTPRTVAIDRNSPDHVVLTNAEFPPKNHVYVEIEFPRTLAWVRTGKVDAAIWHLNKTDVPITLAGFELTPLRSSSPASTGNDASRAVLVASPNRPELAAVLNALPLEGLTARQEATISAEEARHAEFL